MKPLEKDASQKSWEADRSGESTAYQQAAAARLALRKAYADRDEFAYLKSVRALGKVQEPLLRRQLDLLYLAYLGNQFDPPLLEQMVKLSATIEEKFNTYRAAVDGKKLSDNDVEAVLGSSTDSAQRRKVWLASKAIGALVAPDLLRLVKMRNEAARQLGYKNYYELALVLTEQETAKLLAIVDDLAARTDQAFAEVKAGLDAALAKRYGIASKDLRPWHYEDRFFQEAPAVGSVNLDPFFKGKDTVQLAAQYYDTIGLPVAEVVARSDLKAREGKYQHAYCTDIDRAGDVRVMASAIDDTRWAGTMLHELGHAVYALGYDANAAVPFFLRDAAAALTTEGVAMMMESFASSPSWLLRFVKASAADAATLDPKLRYRDRLSKLVFARWAMVMIQFEHALYDNPDQDLNALWWRLVQRNQLVTPPEGRNEPDWAAKIHLVSVPVYYHNYMLGSLYAAQLHAALAKRFFPGQEPWAVTFADHPEVGRYLRERVFGPGQTVPWERFVLDTTGEPLSARAFSDSLRAGPREPPQ